MGLAHKGFNYVSSEKEGTENLYHASVWFSFVSLFTYFLKDIQLRVDRHTTIAELKKKLEDYVGVESAYFKLYRVYINQQEYEMERLTDTLMSTSSESKVHVHVCVCLVGVKSTTS